jgi:xylulokinase
MAGVAGPEVLRKTGNAPSFNHGPKILWWMHECRRVFRSIRAFVQPGGYAAMRLCGLEASEAFVDKTYLHFSGFADNRKGCWDEELCRAFGLDQAKLPRIVNPQAIVGEIIPSMARRCGLRAGTPVVAGCGDTAASFLACGATREGVCVDVAGTASVFAATTGEFRADYKHLTLGCGRAATPGLWHPYAYINGGGMNLEWFRRQIAACGPVNSGCPSFAALDRLASRLVPAADDPIFVPHLAGRVSPSWPDLRGAWAGLDWSHTIAHLYRAVLEAVALEYGIYRRILLELYSGIKLTEIRITGGGQKSSVWNRMKADVLQIPVVQIACGEGAPAGSAMLAGFGVGLFKSLPAVAGQWVRRTGRIRPAKALAVHYSRRIRRYEAVLDRLKELGRPA